ncbi:outer membrane scaffolding protein for murein synthesis (MipA/OmpV family) [Luteibacter jiangsuensis]|uniref:Outer membrane scaffolding protein for murein synthesis (MipA/OmpV family) n=1 Tax=Luteibacter jiangsuensis TaxID=637577 RepID=A0ABT9T4D0_9GAMM|nr:MipA/OmpV family protein [Luteibacter jiangsuensis]MDQ0011453.1 outer membrane scaffolding protein for murein synthesis (MipA/OmpV family) [Luteibacter jiangsuensis]
MCRSRLVFPILLLLAATAQASDDDTPSYAFGAGMQRMPAWQGSKDRRDQAIPYVDIDLPGKGELSTADGLTIDLISGEHWHGGVYGNWLWGRTRGDLGQLGGKVASLSPRFQGGGYLEYAFDKRFSVGGHVAHDTNGAGAYAALYADYRLPDVWYIQHSIELQVEGMNGPAMRRFYGVTPGEAATLGTQAWHPGAGWQSANLEYDAFIPTSRHTGFALAVSYGRLYGNAAQSPLVRQFGSTRQVTETLAFVYHF